MPPDVYRLIVEGEQTPDPPIYPNYSEPAFSLIQELILQQGMTITERVLRRYHLSLKTRGFVILSGLSGSGKTWLTEAYANAIGAIYRLVPVAPNWTTNEDLLGYYNPLTSVYHDTPFSCFLKEAADQYSQAVAAGVAPVPYHLALDEMNLARVEYYFAKFLSALEVRSRHGSASVELSPGQEVLLPPNLYFIGTVNVDETTHSFADRVYDRSQLIELDVDREALWEHLGDLPYRAAVMDTWDAVHEVAPFAYRVLDEIMSYIREAEELGTPWQEALDEQLLQKVLPKCKGADLRVEAALDRFVALANGNFMLSHAKASRMLEGFRQHGFASYF